MAPWRKNVCFLIFSSQRRKRENIDTGRKHKQKDIKRERKMTEAQLMEIKWSRFIHILYYVSGPYPN